MPAVSIHRPVHLVCDWDATLTKKDTLALVAKIGYDKKGLDPATGQILADDEGKRILPWSEYGKLWMDDYEAHKTAYEHKPESRTKIYDERKWLKSLKVVEEASAQRVHESNLFRSVRSTDIAQGVEEAITSGQLELRKGWEDLMRNIVRDGSHTPQSRFRLPGMQRNRVSIVSVNWSRTFIRRSLVVTQQLYAGDGIMAPYLDTGRLSTNDIKFAEWIADGLVVHANEIPDLDKTHFGSDDLPQQEVKGIRTSRDKFNCLPERNQLNLDDERYQAPLENQQLVIYVGDSDTDLECLLAADVGICIRDETPSSAQQSLTATLERLQIPVEHVDELEPRFEDWTTHLWWARDFVEIRKAMQRNDWLSKDA